MEKFKKFKINNQQSIVGGMLAETTPTTLNDGRADRWDSDKKRLIIF